MVFVVMIVAGLALVLIGVVAVFASTNQAAQRGYETTASPTPTRESPTATNPTQSPTKQPSPTPTPTETPIILKPSEVKAKCHLGGPKPRAQHPVDDEWIYGGKIAMRRVPEWKDKGFAFLWVHDIDSQTFQHSEGWFNGASVSALRVQEGFENTEKAAKSSLSCVAGSYYTDLTGLEYKFVKQVSLGGKKGHWVRAQANVDTPELLGIEGDIIDVVVIDTGAEGDLSMFLSTATIGDDTNIKKMEDLINNLRVVE